MATMDALFTVEEKYPGVGRSLLPVFFPGDLLPAESERWVLFAGKTDQVQQMNLQAQPESSQEAWTAHARTFGKK